MRLNSGLDGIFGRPLRVYEAFHHSAVLSRGSTGSGEVPRTANHYTELLGLELSRRSEHFAVVLALGHIVKGVKQLELVGAAEGYALRKARGTSLWMVICTTVDSPGLM